MKKIYFSFICMILLLGCQTADVEPSIKPSYTPISINGDGTKDIPDPRYYPFAFPNMNYTYFENYKDYPFEPNNTEFSLANCWWLSEVSFLAYTHNGFAKMAFILADYPNFKFFENQGTECMVVWNSSSVVVSFRGTELDSPAAILDIALDLRIAPVSFEGGGKVHRGFLEALDNIWLGESGLKHFIDTLYIENPSRPIWITGHSLGGAIASICFTRLDYAKGLYTFGSPNVGDNEFISLTKDRPAWRVENNRDPIPRVPAPSALFNYSNVGEQVYFKESGELIFPEQSHLDYDQVDRVNITLSDHAPVYYSLKIWNALVLSR